MKALRACAAQGLLRHPGGRKLAVAHRVLNRFLREEVTTQGFASPLLLPAETRVLRYASQRNDRRRVALGCFRRLPVGKRHRQVGLQLVEEGSRHRSHRQHHSTVRSCTAIERCCAGRHHSGFAWCNCNGHSSISRANGGRDDSVSFRISGNGDSCRLQRSCHRQHDAAHRFEHHDTTSRAL